MSKKEKLKQRLIKKPKDFSYRELVSLLESLGYIEDNKGNTSGSRVSFINNKINCSINIHKPHPKNILKSYQLKQIIEELQKNNLI